MRQFLNKTQELRSLLTGKGEQSRRLYITTADAESIAVSVTEEHQHEERAAIMRTILNGGEVFHGLLHSNVPFQIQDGPTTVETTCGKRYAIS